MGAGGCESFPTNKYIYDAFLMIYDAILLLFFHFLVLERSYSEFYEGCNSETL